MFWQIAKSVSLLGLVICTGCSSIATPPKFKFPSRFVKTHSSTSEEPPQQEAEKVEPADIPKRQPLIAQRSKPNLKPTHDAETQQLIESELKDVTAAERAEWLDYLATIDSAMVPYALKSRRINDGNPDTELASSKSNRDRKSSQILTTGHSVSSADQIETSVQDGREIFSPTNSAPKQTETREKSRSDEERSPEKNEPPREWTGKLKSLTEWDHNPLNFGRDDDQNSTEHKGARRPKPLPQIISNPFRNHEEEKESAPANSKAKVVNFEVEDRPLQTAQAIPANNLRITPGAELWEEELHKLVSVMEAEASASGMAGSGTLSRDELRQQVALRMLYLINDQPQLAMQPIPGLHSVDQEFWTSIFWGLSNYLNEKGIDPTERSTKTIEQLRSATHYLQITAKLQLRNVNFCSQINGFGSFDQFESDVFSAGQPVLIYCDVRNFQSEASADGFFVTKLRSTIEIYQGSQTGQVVDRNSFPATEDLCRSIRTDYYNSYRIDLPSHLNSGPHVLKLTVYDELSGKSVTETMPFTVQ